MNKVQDWLNEIEDAKKREKDFREDGKEIIEIYEGEKAVPFNILFSNTETLLPALFSNPPRPVISRRFHNKPSVEDKIGKHCATACERMLEYLLDTDMEGYDKFEDSMIDATLDSLLPGRGVTSVKYDAQKDDFSDETVCTDSRVWNRVYFGYAKKWSNVPWIAYEEYLDKEECKKKFPKTWMKLKFVENEQDEDEGKRKTAVIYQIWNKADRKIKYVCDQYKEGYLLEEDDPLELTGFYNCPKPIQFIRKSSNLVPTSPYKLYENQAKELNEIQSRLNKVIKAIKVRGAYNSQLGTELEQILDGDDNELVPTAENSLLAEGGFDKNIWLLPLQELITVAQQLYQARESAKRVIYEITGVSDIIRGQSMASETLGAQKIKEAWGTMRLKRTQKEVQRYALDTMKIMLEVAIKKFSETTWKDMTGLALPLSEEKEKAQQLLQMAQQSGIQDPDMKQNQDIAALPSWGEVLERLSNDYWRSYKLDIETNSTLDVEATEDKQLVAEFMNAFAQLINGLMPMVKEGILPFDAAKSMMLAVVKRYRFGREVEEELMSMIPTPPQTKEMQQAAQKLQKDKETFEAERQKAGNELDKRFNELELEKLQFEFEKKAAKLELDYQEKLAKQKLEGVQDLFMAEIDKKFEKQKSDVQSILDKNVTRMEKKLADISATVQ